MYSRLFLLAFALLALTLCTATPSMPSDADLFHSEVSSATESDLNNVVRHAGHDHDDDDHDDDDDDHDDDDDDDDDDGKGGKGKVVTRRIFACNISAGRGKFRRCRACVQGCLKKFGRRISVPVHTGKGGKGDDDDDDDDDDDCDDDDDDDDDDGCKKKKPRVKTRVTCAGSRKCLRCNLRCRRKFGAVKIVKMVVGGGKGGKGDDEDDDDRR